MKSRGQLLGVLGGAALSLIASRSVLATPYASGVAISGGTNVNFILNETADALTYKINGGAPIALDGTTIGAKNFTLGAATDTFSISAEKTATVGYSIPTGGTIAASAQASPQITNAAGFNKISDDANVLTHYNSPRGVSVSQNPNASNFGYSYISNSAVGTPTGRTLGDGLYAVRADQSDAFGYGDTPSDPGNQFDGLGASANSPFRTFVGSNGEVYVADFSDANGSVWRLNADMTTGNAVLQGVGGPATLPPGQNHGSVTSVYVEGSSAGGNLVLYTLDEDLTSSQFGSGSTTDKNALWRYDINGGATPSDVTPTKINQNNVLLPLATSDMERGADGKFYLMQNRSTGNESGVVVLNADGSTAFASFTATQALFPGSTDIYRQVFGISVSPDQKWMATLYNNGNVGVTPLVSGIPDLANRMIVDTGIAVISGRDIAFDAAGNIHYVSSGQQLYRVLSPGGHTLTTLSFNGSQYAFSSQTIVPATNNSDFNNDGLVDGADFLIWQAGQGLTGQPNKSTGDANGDGNVNAADLVIFKAKFGGPPATAAAGAVPEPASLGLIGLAALGLVATRRRGR